ncbi:MAG: hypothetical protein IJU41_04445 [Clostridia bacterium]|nr:hypothetical protein [Clostridia bacterium]
MIKTHNGFPYRYNAITKTATIKEADFLKILRNFDQLLKESEEYAKPVIGFSAE